MSSIQVAKLGMGFLSANQRHACKNCRHGEERRADRMPPYDTATWYCKKGGFMVSAMAACDQHQAPKEVTEPPG